MIKAGQEDRVVREIGYWIGDRLKDADAGKAVVGLSGGADSALVALIINKVLGKERLVVVKMPCHSSQNSLDRANELIEKFGLTAIEVKLDAAFDSIAAQVNAVPGFNGKSNDSEGALRSCLRAPTLDYVAKLCRGIIVGTGNRDEDEMTRYFQKRGDGAVDCSPIAKLHKSEVYQLLRFLDCPESIIIATPSADLWGPDAGQEDEKQLGMTYAEVEWGIHVLLDDERSRVRDVLYRLSPEQLALYFTDRQLTVLKTLDKMERATLHKAVMPPVFDVRKVLANAFAGF